MSIVIIDFYIIIRHTRSLGVRFPVSVRGVCVDLVLLYLLAASLGICPAPSLATHGPGLGYQQPIKARFSTFGVNNSPKLRFPASPSFHQRRLQAYQLPAILSARHDQNASLLCAPRRFLFLQFFIPSKYPVFRSPQQFSVAPPLCYQLLDSDLPHSSLSKKPSGILDRSSVTTEIYNIIHHETRTSSRASLLLRLTIPLHRCPSFLLPP